ncbi:MAG: rod shape-determining protein MreC [Chitinophagales bacterium]|nr:rod shape-determining protein MreC [Chitinophagales bacterium]
MYNLLRFFLRYHLFILFLSLEVVCFFLIYRNNKYNQAAYVNVANGISGKVYNTYRSGVDYFYLRRYNDSLALENAFLREQLLDSKFDNRIDTGTLSDSSKRYVQNYTYITARVIRNSVNRATNLIYLDKGKLHGVDKQMGVIAPNGIVGQVITVTDNYAAVMSVLSKDFKVSVKFRKNEYFGNLQWDGINSTSASLQEIPKHVPVQVGDTVVTSGYSQLFPRNVMVGVVNKVKSYPEKTFLEIGVTLTTDFGNLGYVYVTKNLRKRELVQLDSLAGSIKND